MDYCTLEELKDFLKIEDDSENDLLSNLILQATAMVDSELWDNLWKKTYTRRIDWNWANRIVMENVVNSVESVQDVRASYVYEVDYIEWSIIYLTESTNRWIKNIQVIYERWFEDAPQDFKRFFLEYCRELYKAKDTTSTEVVKSKRLWDLSLTFFAPSELKDESLKIDFEQILQKYKNFNLY